jgi:GNAT superfamily N-acetyltransferase
MVNWVHLRLDVDRFDGTEFEPYLQRAEADGIRFTTLAELGDTPENRRALYELNRICSKDIPERGEFYTFEEYLAQRIDVLSFTPEGVILALKDGEWIGMAAVSLHPGKAYSEMTGVLAGHRGKGLSLGLKLLAIRFVKDKGYGGLEASHHPRNDAAIAMNRRLGFVDAVVVGPLSPADRPRWQELFAGYNRFYERELTTEAADRAWAEFRKGERMHALGAWIGGELAGIVHFLPHASTTAADVCYLQDLFTAPEARGQGVARALIDAVTAWARERGCSRVYWLTHEGNATARRLYDQVAINRGFIHYQITL